MWEIPLTAGEKRFFSALKTHRDVQKIRSLNSLSTICRTRRQRNFGLQKRARQRIGRGIWRQRAYGCFGQSPRAINAPRLDPESVS
jgi:hypothetical protein